MRKKWPYFKYVCIAVDFCLILIAYYASFTLRHDVMGGTVTVDVRSNGYIYLSIVYAAMMVLCFYLMHLYELPQVMKGTGISRGLCFPLRWASSCCQPHSFRPSSCMYPGWHL